MPQELFRPLGSLKGADDVSGSALQMNRWCWLTKHCPCWFSKREISIRRCQLGGTFIYCASTYVLSEEFKAIIERVSFFGEVRCAFVHAGVHIEPTRSSSLGFIVIELKQHKTRRLKPVKLISRLITVWFPLFTTGFGACICWLIFCIDRRRKGESAASPIPDSNVRRLFLGVSILRRFNEQNVE